METSLGENEKEYLDFLNELRDEMAAKGLTQEELEKISTA